MNLRAARLICRTASVTSPRRLPGRILGWCRVTVARLHPALGNALCWIHQYWSQPLTGYSRRARVPPLLCTPNGRAWR
jgi:hypothetical protein